MSSHYIAFKTADTSRSTTTTLADDPHLTFTDLPAGDYTMEGLLLVYGGAGRLNLGLNTGLNGSWAVRANGDSTSDDTAYGLDGDEIGDIPLSTSHGPGLAVYIYGELSGGIQDFALEWAQEDSNATASTIKEGSYIHLTEIS